jgi:hypothetical protein
VGGGFDRFIRIGEGVQGSLEVAAAVGGPATKLTTATKATGAAEGLVARAGRRGIDPEHHNANMTVRVDGQMVQHERLVSGNMTEAEAPLGYPKSSLATHTEVRGIKGVNVPLGPRVDITFTGQKRPCPPCKGFMNKTASETGVRITYRYRDGGRTQQWDASQVNPDERQQDQAHVFAVMRDC